MHAITVTHLNPQDVLARAAGIAAIHQAAFDEADNDAANYRDVEIPEMAGYSGFACVIAETDEQMVGFAIGHDAAARPQWLQNVMTAVRDTPVRHWLPDAWYLADIAVLPDRQRGGIGRHMHDALMDLTSDRHRVLVTYHGAHPAKLFYRRLGWIEIVPDLAYAPGAPLTSLMMYAGRKP